MTADADSIDTRPTGALQARFSLFDAAAGGPLRHAPGRTLLAVLAIALGVALGFSVYLINRVAADEVQGASRSLFGLADLAVQAPGAGFDEALFPALARLAGVVAASPVIEMQVRLPGRDRPLKVVGIDPFRAAQMQPALVGTGRTASRQGQGLLEENVRMAESRRGADARAAGRRRSRRAGRVWIECGFACAGLLPAGCVSPTRRRCSTSPTAQWRLQRLGRLDRVDLRLSADANPADGAQGDRRDVAARRAGRHAWRGNR